LRKPTLAGVHGAVRGGGLGLVAACDVAIATRATTFRLSEVRLGIIPAMISPYLVAAIGQRMARRYMLSGEEFDAVEAARIGLVHEVVEEEELDARIARMLAELRSGGPAALAAAKELIPLSARGPLDGALVDETARRIAAIRATPEAQEGLAAFLEKRRPAWTAAMPKGKARRKAR
jgi:methylglutaconyl-CoA hydratase